jgi:hypothetical protein
MQTKTQSIIEQITNVGTGFIIAQIMVLCLIPLWDTKSLSLFDSFCISSIFTSVSLIRGYIFRRYFNKKHSKISTRKDS